MRRWKRPIIRVFRRASVRARRAACGAGSASGSSWKSTAPATNELGDIKFNADGSVLLSTGTHDHGQGHWTSFAQVVSERLGIPFASIRLMQTIPTRCPRAAARADRSR